MFDAVNDSKELTLHCDCSNDTHGTQGLTCNLMMLVVVK